MSGALNPRRTIEELRELHVLTGDADGAQRTCWTSGWSRARSWWQDKLEALPLEVRQDEAANLWATLPGRSDRTVVIGGHLDSVPNGGWLDGSLNLLAGLEVVRRLAEADERPVTVRLVDWADEEGARFGRSLVGSSACSGTLNPVEDLAHLTDAGGTPLAQALTEHGVDLERMTDCGRELANAAAYLELHIEQGPVLERKGLPLGVVLGTVGVERHRVTFTGQPAHAGSTPMDARRDAWSAAARFGLSVREHAGREGGVATVGSCVTRPGIVTAVVGECELALDQRHLDPEALDRMLVAGREASSLVAAEEDVGVSWETVWEMSPVHFDAGLIELAAAAVEETAGVSHRLPSGPLHDAVEVARAGVPTVMLFVQSLRGLSHAKEEDTREEHLELAVEALDRLVSKAVDDVAAGELRRERPSPRRSEGPTV